MDGCVSRRHLLVSTVSAGGVALAGCSNLEPRSESTTERPYPNVRIGSRIVGSGTESDCVYGDSTPTRVVEFQHESGEALDTENLYVTTFNREEFISLENCGSLPDEFTEGSTTTIGVPDVSEIQLVQRFNGEINVVLSEVDLDS